jgi:hypothetical protein
VALLVYAEERIDEQTDYPAWGLCYLPSEQVKTAVASVERGEFRFRMSMKEYGSREEIDYSFWTEKELLAAMTEKFFLAVPV